MGMFSFDEQPGYDDMVNTIDDLKRQVKENPIYTITMFEKLDADKYWFLDTGDRRVVGFYHSFKDADKAICENAGDVYETVYDFALIEEVFPGVYPDVPRRWLYCYIPSIDGYEIMSEPSYMEHICNFSIG